MARVAWVESPLQMVNALEYAHSTGESVHVCLRGDVAQLGNTGRALAPHLPRGVTMSGPWSSTMRSPFATARRRLVGDVCSGQVRAALTVTGVGDLVIVDDGSAMLSTARRLELGLALGRHGRREPIHLQALGAATTSRLLGAASKGRVHLFTAYVEAPEVGRVADRGVRLRRNSYAWLRSTSFDHTPPQAAHVVVGSAMVDDRFMHADAYLGWLRELAADGPLAYFPHRREAAGSLALWTTVPGLTVHRSHLPIEIVLAAAVGVRKVSTLPSSVVMTLSAILDSDTELSITPVPEHWLTAHAQQPLRDVLTTVADPRSISAAA